MNDKYEKIAEKTNEKIKKQKRETVNDIKAVKFFIVR